MSSSPYLWAPLCERSAGRTPRPKKHSALEQPPPPPAAADPQRLPKVPKVPKTPHPLTIQGGTSSCCTRACRREKPTALRSPGSPAASVYSRSPPPPSTSISLGRRHG